MSGRSPPDGEWAIDLAIVTVLTVVAVGVFLSSIDSRPVAWVVGVPFLLFVPGYALVSALFPKQPDGTPGDPVTDAGSSGPNWVVRVILSVVLSAIVVGVIGVLLDQVLSIRLEPVLGTIGAVTVVGVVVAMGRRLQVSPRQRADPFSGRALGLHPSGTKRQTLTLVLAVLLFVGAVAFAGAVPSQGESYSEAYLLTEDGELAAEDYPTTFVASDGHPLSVGLENHEHRSVSYEVVVVAQEVDADGAVTTQEEVDRFSADLDHGDDVVVDRDIAPTMTGEGIRLQFLVYKDAPIENGSAADQRLQLWIDVVEGSESA